MNLSNITRIRKENNLVNYFSSPFDNCVSTIANSNMHKIDDFCVGINCFDELLFRNELISYARDNFKKEIKGDMLLFYSKRLNLYVFYENALQKLFV
jgi:hypothetical protein